MSEKNPGGGEIKVVESDIRVELDRGDQPRSIVLVRPLGRYDTLDVMRACASERDPDIRMAATAMLMRRMQIVGADALRHYRTGEEVPFATERVAGLARSIASRTVLESLSDADLTAIDEACPATGALSPAKRGN